MKHFFITVFLLIFTVYCKNVVTIRTIDTDIDELSDFNYLPNDNYIEHTYFQLEYDSTHQQARWVAYNLTANETIKKFDRSNYRFREDPNVINGPSLEDYKGSGYDRGHMAPAGDMSFNSDALYNSFYLTNMSPQTASFNRGIWKKLESKVREWAIDNDSIYVITGPILEDNLPTIGDGISVPNYYYKIILDIKPEIKVIAFLMKNEKAIDTNLKKYIISVDSIEILTEIDYFYILDDIIENKIESDTSSINWNW